MDQVLLEHMGAYDVTRPKKKSFLRDDVMAAILTSYPKSDAVNQCVFTWNMIAVRLETTEPRVLFKRSPQQQKEEAEEESQQQEQDE